MNFSSVTLEATCGKPDQLPESNLPEFCFSGRSNVGKSSLINKVLGRKAIARVSSTPGKTVTVNFYKADKIRIVDLPGYGFAKTADRDIERFSELTEYYFSSKRNIKCCFQLVDMRRAPTKQDMAMFEYLKYYKIPHVAVLTKCDKLNRAEFDKNLNMIKEEISKISEETAVIPFSALKGTGTEEIAAQIEKLK